MDESNSIAPHPVATVVFLAHAVAVVQRPEGVLADRLHWDVIELRRDVEVVLPDGLSGWKHRLAAQLAGSASRLAGWDGSAARLDDRVWGRDGRGARPADLDDPAWRLGDRVWGGDGRGARPADLDDPAWRLDDRAWGGDGQGERSDDPA